MNEELMLFLPLLLIVGVILMSHVIMGFWSMLTTLVRRRSRVK